MSIESLLDCLLFFLPSPQLSCGTCSICAEPASIPGVDVILQARALTDTTVSVWIKADVEVYGMITQTVCTSKGNRVGW